MRAFYSALQDLVAWPFNPDATVLSAYINLSGPDPLGAARLGLQACGPLGARLLASLPQRLSDGEPSGGLAAFICEDPPLDVFLTLGFAFEDHVSLGPAPALRQLLFYAEEYEPAICVSVAPGAAYISEVLVGDVSRSWIVRPSHGRSVEGELQAQLARCRADDPRLHLILLGDTAELEATLSDDLAEAVIERIPDALVPEDAAFLPRIHQALQDYERRVEDIGIAYLMDQHQREGAAVVGVEDTLAAINAGRVGALFLLADFAARGWICQGCGTLGAAPTPSACPACGAQLNEVALEEHVLDHAAACGAELEVVAHSKALAACGGLGALLV